MAVRCQTRRCGHTRSRLAGHPICQVDELIDAADNEIAQFCRSLNSATFSSEAEPVAPLALLEALSDQHRQTIGQIDNLKVPLPQSPSHPPVDAGAVNPARPLNFAAQGVGAASGALNISSLYRTGCTGRKRII